MTMRFHQLRYWRQWHPAFLIGVFLVLLALVACGPQSNTGSSAGGATPAPTPTIVNGYGTSHGCPSDAVVTAAPTQAKVLVQMANSNSTVSAHVGDVIEVRLPFGQKWSGPLNSQGGLSLQQPAGYAWNATHSCIWRFVATRSGTTQLHFNASALCSPGKMCPMYITVDPFTINVAA